ncbi:MAG: (Fe-S)-binding protein, partial [Tepidiphilus sp.]|nr:(Fe-S)-binding protein [Tepidiphilus sp.]
MPPDRTGTVGLFATCLMNAMRPNIGFAAARLLEDAGWRVEVPREQTCCGQPAYNGGDEDAARALARRTIAQFEAFDALVAPSGSCLATLKHDYPRLLRDDPLWAGRAQALADKSWELLTFLHERVGPEHIRSRFPHRVTYHDSCSGLRQLGIHEAPRALLARVEGLRLVEAEEREVCCGFGGTFSVKYPALSERLAENKVQRLLATRAEVV